jgi:hypothetical protein
VGLSLSTYVAFVEQFPDLYIGLTAAWLAIALVSITAWIFTVARGAPRLDGSRREGVREQVIRMLRTASLVGTIVFGVSAALAIGLAHVSAWVALAPLVSLLVFAFYSSLLIRKRK